MKHLISTRIKFTDYKLLKKYLEVSKKTFIPSILLQTNKNFTLGVIANEEHRDLISSTINEVCLGLNKERPSIIFFENKLTDYVRYVKKENINIQTRHDCDDWMREDYIETIQNLYTKNKDSFDKFIIHSKVFKLDHKTGEIYEHGLDYSKGNFTSMFLTLCQKEVTNFVYDKNHRFMNEITTNIFLLKDQNTIKRFLK